MKLSTQIPNNVPKTNATNPCFSSFIFLLLVGGFLLGGCHHHVASSSQLRCPKVASQKVTGWLDRIEGSCAVLWLASEQTQVVHRSSLPSNIKEGDFLKQGVIQLARRRQVEKQVYALLHRRNAPRIVRLDRSKNKSSEGPSLLPQQRRPCASRRTSKQERRRHLLPRRRWSHRPWRRRWQSWSRRKRCKTRKSTWSYKRQKRRWRRLNTYKPIR